MSKWMQAAAKRMKSKGTVGSFTRYCKSRGYDGVTCACIAKAKSAGGKLAQKANFAARVHKCS